MKWDMALACAALERLATERGCATVIGAEVALVCGPSGKVDGVLDCLRLGDQTDLPTITFCGVTTVALRRTRETAP